MDFMADSMSVAFQDPCARCSNEADWPIHHLGQLSHLCDATAKAFSSVQWAFCCCSPHYRCAWEVPSCPWGSAIPTHICDCAVLRGRESPRPRGLSQLLRAARVPRLGASSCVFNTGWPRRVVLSRCHLCFWGPVPISNSFPGLPLLSTSAIMTLGHLAAQDQPPRSKSLLTQLSTPDPSAHLVGGCTLGGSVGSLGDSALCSLVIRGLWVSSSTGPPSGWHLDHIGGHLSSFSTSCSLCAGLWGGRRNT